MNSEGHYLVVISVANYSDGHYILPQISLPGSDLHYSFFTVYSLAAKLSLSYVVMIYTFVAISHK